MRKSAGKRITKKVAKKQVGRWRAPENCTFNQLLRIDRDNFNVGDFWILADGDHVSLAQQRTGEAASQMIGIPRRTFNRLIRWYQRPQRLGRERS